MPSHDEQVPDDFRRLEELLDRMLQAGLVAGHAHTNDHAGVSLTPAGRSILEAFWRLDDAIGPLGPTDRILLWNLFRQVREIPPYG